MTNWTPEDTRVIGDASEIHIATIRPDGTARSRVPIWVVRVGDALFVRSYRGPQGGWFRQVTAHPYARVHAAGRDATVHLAAVEGTPREAIDRAYWAKYGRGGYGAAMTAPAAASTTLRLEPAENVEHRD